MKSLNEKNAAESSAAASEAKEQAVDLLNAYREQKALRWPARDGPPSSRACRMEREAVTDRLRRLTAAEQSAAEENDRRRIRWAIAAHRAALARLKDTAGAE